MRRIPSETFFRKFGSCPPKWLMHVLRSVTAKMACEPLKFLQHKRETKFSAFYRDADLNLHKRDRSALKFI